MADQPPQQPSGAAPGPTLPPPPALAPAQAAFDRGDFRAAHQALQALRAGHSDPTLVAAADQLAARLAPDPWALRFGILALVLLALVAGLYVH